MSQAAQNNSFVARHVQWTATGTSLGDAVAYVKGSILTARVDAPEITVLKDPPGGYRQTLQRRTNAAYADIKLPQEI